MRLHYTLNIAEAQTVTFDCVDVTRWHAEEFFKDLIMKFFRNPEPVICDRQENRISVIIELNINLRVYGSILYRVIQ